MGERTSAVVSASSTGYSRTDVPNGNMAANHDALARYVASDKFRINVGPQIVERAPLQYESKKLAQLLMKEPSEEEWTRQMSSFVAQPAYSKPVLNEIEITAGRGGIPDSLLTELVRADPSTGAHASAVASTQEESWTNCCPCLPCNLL